MKQAAPLEIKVKMTQQRIREWVNHWGEDGVYISFSGGKDSTVLLHIAREMYPGLKAMFIDTGLEYPEIREFVRTFDNVDIVRPKMNFRQVIEKYGYPFISKEVSECVYGARKYLTQLLEMNTISQTDRQTDRQTDPTKIPNYYCYARLTGTGEYAKPDKSVRGGYDSKYRKLTGIAEFDREQAKRRRSKTPAGETSGDAGREGSDKSGEYP